MATSYKSTIKVIRLIRQEISDRESLHYSLDMDGKYLGKNISDIDPICFHISYRNYMWFWVPIIGPMIGAVVGAWIYQIFIAFHIPDSKDWAKNQNDKPHPLLKVDAYVR
jgi:hypothetical protein